MNYEKRLLKFLKDYSGLFTYADVAALWKRNSNDVFHAASNLIVQGRVKAKKGGILVLKNA